MSESVSQPQSGQPSAPVDGSVHPGNGFRLLADGEIINEDDEFCNPIDGIWYLTADEGLTQRGDIVRRRRIAPNNQALPRGGAQETHE